jgi:hypothetical protein
MFKFVTPILLATATLCASETEQPAEPVRHSMGYVDLGVGPLPIPLPSFGLGYRLQRGHHGFDASERVTTVVHFTEWKTSLLYHHYFHPNLKSQFYAGGGVGLSALSGRSFNHQSLRGTISPEFVFGKQYQNELGYNRFFQAQISWPTFRFGHMNKPFYMPLVVLSYGIGF